MRSSRSPVLNDTAHVVAPPRLWPTTPMASGSTRPWSGLAGSSPAASTSSITNETSPGWLTTSPTLPERPGTSRLVSGNAGAATTKPSDGPHRDRLVVLVGMAGEPVRQDEERVRPARSSGGRCACTIVRSGSGRRLRARVGRPGRVDERLGDLVDVERPSGLVVAAVEPDDSPVSAFVSGSDTIHVPRRSPARGEHEEGQRRAMLRGSNGSPPAWWPCRTASSRSPMRHPVAHSDRPPRSTSRHGVRPPNGPSRRPARACCGTRLA